MERPEVTTPVSSEKGTIENETPQVKQVSTELIQEALSFQGGRLKYFLPEWEALTSDSEILQMVKGVKLEFTCDEENLPKYVSAQPKLTPVEVSIINSEVDKLCLKGVISKCEPEADQFISPVFTRPKKDGSHRMILNLKSLNEEIKYQHFKMDTLQTALKLVTKGCYMASIDLKDAYYSVPIFEDHKKFLRFLWLGQLWEYNCLPNGLALAPRKFTKLLKPVFATLRGKGHVSSSFLDDSLLVAEDENSCKKNVVETVQLFRSLGFIIHPDKSVFEPTQNIQFLGVIIDSNSMEIILTPERAKDLKKCCINAEKKKKLTIRALARVIGKLVAAFPAVKWGPLYYRHLEEDKKAALRAHRGNFNKSLSLSPAAKGELRWWIDNVSSASNNILQTDPEITITSDASLSGWGCACNGVLSGGSWLPVESKFHINYLELKAALFALKCFQTHLAGKHVRILVDNSTAVACINHMGSSHSQTCNQITFSIWQWCLSHRVWLSAAHIPGKENTAADRESRKINLDAEWKLDGVVLKEALAHLQVNPTIDLFASRLNKQFANYVAYRPDPEALAVDAFSISWKEHICYCFPPFSVINQVLQKIQQDKATGVIVVPQWPTQVWWPVLMKLLVQNPIPLIGNRLLTLPSHPKQEHPLLKRNLRLLACLISGVASSDRDSQTKLQIS